MITTEETLASLIELVKRERNASIQEDEAATLLSMRALVALGYALDNLYILSKQKDTITFKSEGNISRFRVGDQLTFVTEEHKPIPTTLIAINRNGLELQVRVAGLKNNLPVGPWVATEQSYDLSNAVISALQKLIPGAPGWGFARRLLEQTSRLLPGRLATPEQAKSLYLSLVRDSKEALDPSQYQAFEKCVASPSVYGVQGPPGTGKTRLLAFVVEALVRQNQQVVVVAFTHQAVNNALTSIKQIFPNRNVIKVGDLLRTEALDENIIIQAGRDIHNLSKDVIVGMTYMSAIYHLIIREKKSLNPNVLVIDEAGQLPLSQGICAGVSGAGSILLFGDDKQMPPVFSGEVDEEAIAISLFAQLRNTHPDALAMLTISYRMNTELCKAIGDAFYARDRISPLLSSDLSRHRLFPGIFSSSTSNLAISKSLAPEPSLIWLQTSDTSSTQYNKLEAELASELVVICIRNGLPSRNIAVVTPFRRQAANINNLISKKMGLINDLPIVDTVERVQGMTVDIVVVSFCATDPNYIAHIGKFLFSPNRLNVAVSRARMKAIILASPYIFRELPRDFQGLVGRKIFMEFLNKAHPVRLDAP